MFIFFFRMLQS